LLFQIFWSENGELVCIATEDSFFILKFSAEAVEHAKDDKEKVTEDGIEEAFEVRVEVLIQELIFSMPFFFSSVRTFSNGGSTSRKRHYVSVSKLPGMRRLAEC
jgi:hypothetical protein